MITFWPYKVSHCDQFRLQLLDWCRQTRKQIGSIEAISLLLFNNFEVLIKWTMTYTEQCKQGSKNRAKGLRSAHHEQLWRLMNIIFFSWTLNKTQSINQSTDPKFECCSVHSTKKSLNTKKLRNLTLYSKTNTSCLLVN